MKYRNWLLSASGVACLLAALASCSGNGGDAVTVNGDVPIAYVKRCSSGGGFTYQPGQRPTTVRTGTGVDTLDVPEFMPGG